MWAKHALLNILVGCTFRVVYGHYIGGIVILWKFAQRVVGYRCGIILLSLNLLVMLEINPHYWVLCWALYWVLLLCGSVLDDHFPNVVSTYFNEWNSSTFPILQSDMRWDLNWSQFPEHVSGAMAEFTLKGGIYRMWIRQV